jgi:RNA polymerase sigma-70 factor, ECF subfamily
MTKAQTQPDARAGTANQFATLLREHWDRAYRFAYHLAGNAQEAEDLVQQASLEAFAAFGRFQRGSRFDHWLMRILHNSFIDGARRAKRKRFVSLEEPGVGALAAPASGDPAAGLETALDGPVLQAVKALPLEFRAAVFLVDLEGYAYEEAAAVMHCPVGTVRSRLHRGRLALREALGDYIDAARRGDL